jgi:hypothetical protein
MHPSAGPSLASFRSETSEISRDACPLPYPPPMTGEGHEGDYFFSMFHSASDGVLKSPLMLVRIAVGVVNWPSGAKVG